MLEGNGAPIVRLAARIQSALQRLYRVEEIADVRDFISIGERGERESLFIRETEGVLEIRVRLPEGRDLDAICQVIEGVSHFVYVADRARIDRPSTQLELEMQAEVDKWVVLASMSGVHDAQTSEALRIRLYENVSFTGENEERYRMANACANRFVRLLEREFVAPKRFADMRSALRDFFGRSQEDKLRYCTA